MTNVLKYPSTRLKNMHTEARDRARFAATAGIASGALSASKDIGSIEATIKGYNSTRWIHWLLLGTFSLIVYALYIFTLQYGWRVLLSPITGVAAPKFAHLLGLAAFSRFWFLGLPSQKLLDEQEAKRKADKDVLWLDQYRRDWGRHGIGLAACGLMSLIFWTIA